LALLAFAFALGAACKPSPAQPPAATCDDGLQNGAETDVDCGGGTCPGCAAGSPCLLGYDCASLVCANRVCQAQACNDGKKNDSESDIDCGGACAPCAVGRACLTGSDCASGVCTDSLCQLPACTDQVRNGNETGIDCGGDCTPCAAGAACFVPADCQSAVCTNQLCQVPMCTDNVQNGGEGAVDCGGDTICPRCMNGISCAVDADCVSGTCSTVLFQCVAAGCTTGQNPTQTDENCGGQCPPCADTKLCLIADDCVSGVCGSLADPGHCQAPSCTDQIKNGAETDVDCGGGTISGCPACLLGQACIQQSDCQVTLACAQNLCVPIQAVGLALGAEHTCARFNNGKVRCWGYGSDGRLGYGSTANVGDAQKPYSAGDVDVGAEALDVVAGAEHTCALVTGGAVRCWGHGANGVLGYGNTNNIGDSAKPSSAGDVNVGGTVVQLSAGSFHTCAVLSTGTVRCWGYGANGQLGYGSTVNVGDTASPASAGDVALAGKALAVSAGGQHTCALLVSGDVQCWGLGALGQLGSESHSSFGDLPKEMPPGVVDVGDAVKSVSAGWAHTCVLTSTGSVKCWGSGADGRLGYGNTANVGDRPTQMPPPDVFVGGGVSLVTAAGDHTCALLTGGAAHCWGRGDTGQLGYGNTLSIGDDEGPQVAGDINLGSGSGPILIVGGKANAGAHTCALSADGAVHCWGGGQYGRLGYGNTLSVGAQQSPAAAGSVVVLP